MTKTIALSRLGLAGVLASAVGILGGWGPMSIALTMMGVLVFYRFTFGEISRRIEGYSLTEEVVTHDNQAVCWRLAGALFGVGIALLGVVQPSGLGPKTDFDNVAFFGLLFTALVMFSRVINDLLVLYDFPNNTKVVQEKNTAVAVVEAATYAATGLILRGALEGSMEYGLWASLLGFAIGQAFLVVISRLYRVAIPETGEAIGQNNNAVAVSFGGFLLAGGYMLGEAMKPAFRQPGMDAWLSDLGSIGLHSAGWILWMMVVYILVDIFVLRGSRLKDEIVRDKNVGAAVIGAVLYFLGSLIFTAVWQ